MSPVAVLSGRPPRRRHTGAAFEGTTAEAVPYPRVVEPSELKGAVGIQRESEIDLGAAFRQLWVTPLRAEYEQANRLLVPQGAFTYWAVVPSLPSSTMEELTRDIWTATSTFVAHTPLLIAGAELAPSFTTYLSNVTATTPATLEVRREYLQARFSIALADARGEDFEFGTESQLTQRIARLVLRYGNEALGTLATILNDQPVSVPVLGELFRTVGRIRNGAMRDNQRSVLLRFLAAPDIRVRHVAATGLAALDDPEAIPALQAALAAERSNRLRMHLRQVLTQLEATGAALRHR